MSEKKGLNIGPNMPPPDLSPDDIQKVVEVMGRSVAEEEARRSQGYLPRNSPSLKRGSTIEK